MACCLWRKPCPRPSISGNSQAGTRHQLESAQCSHSLLPPAQPHPPRTLPSALFSLFPFPSGIQPRASTGKGKWAGRHFNSKRQLARALQTSGWGQKVFFSAAAGQRQQEQDSPEPLIIKLSAAEELAAWLPDKCCFP